MTLPVVITEVSYFNNAYRGDLVISRGVLYYFPWVNVELENKQKVDTGPLVRLFPLDLIIGLVIVAIQAFRQAHKESKLKELGLWQPGQTDDALKARLDAFIADVRTKPAQLTEYEYGLPQPLRFAAGEIKNLSLNSGLSFDTECDTHDFETFHKTDLLQALKEAGFVVNNPA